MASAEPPHRRPLPTRPFGKTGRTVTSFGLGCYYVGACADDASGVAVVRRALDAGCTYFDTAPSYLAGVSERRVGLALAGRRGEVFLSTKTLERDGSAARRELEASLKRLKTDAVDMIQVHCVRDADELRAVLAKGGVLEALRRAQSEGLAKFVGVTGHQDPVVMKAAIETNAFDSVLLPLNATDLHWASFIETALPAAVKLGIARVGMKVFASGALVRPTESDAAKGVRRLSAEDCLRFAYGLDVSTSIVGCATTDEVDVAVRVALEATPLDAAARAALIKSAKQFTGSTEAGGVEWYKKPA
jgi:aryl-alcohol dehydrogenase-like predicted oxidoreductase